jgi:hypothetical protein
MRLLFLKLANLLNASQTLLVGYFHQVYGLQIARDEKRHKKRSPNRAHWELGGQVLSSWSHGVMWFWKSQHDKQAKHTKQTKTTFLNRTDT